MIAITLVSSLQCVLAIISNPNSLLSKLEGCNIMAVHRLSFNVSVVTMQASNNHEARTSGCVRSR